MNDPEPCGIKQEDVEQQIGWCLFLNLHKFIILKAAKIIWFKMVQHQLSSKYINNQCSKLSPYLCLIHNSKLVHCKKVFLLNILSYFLI